MPSFLSKVFGRKKDDKESPHRVADTELLDGKFESVSPSATKFPEVANERLPRHKEKDSPFNVFRSKSRPSSPESKDRRVEVPHLSLNLPGLRDEEASRELGVVFDADPESSTLSEEAIGRRRLNPLETLILVRACSDAIIARGLETLGIMHPHWYAASPEQQRRLISLFLRSLAPKGSIITLSATPSTIATAFNSEMSSTKSPYDVAAVLRWGLRHLQLEGTSFGKDDNWYKTFFDAERSAGWPPNGYSSTLAPLLPTSHLELLTATLELFSSLAAHAEANGISGSKLSKFFGLWLLTVEHAQKDDDWSTFYARWERAGRMLEHLFLSRIRDDATESRMPTRLLELIQRYPYRTDPNADLLARPRFSTVQYDALFVRIETELSATADQPSHHPLRIISEAFKAEASFDAGEHAALWESIRKSGVMGGSSTPGEHPEFSHIFADETLRFFSLVPMDMGSSAIGSPSFNLYTRPSRPNSSSLGDKDTAITLAAAGSSPPRHSKTPASAIPPSDVNSPIGPDWITFSTSGFLDDTTERPPLASTLMEKERDMEVTIPRPSSPRLSLFNSRKSSDRPRTPAKSEVKPSPPPAVLGPVNPVSKSTQVSLVQLDEAFVDFWSDALFDPVSASWPAFIICKLRNVETGVDGKRIEWLVLEQAFKRPPPSLPTPAPEASTSSHTSHESPARARTSSPNSSTSDSSFVFGSMFKRFGLLTSPAKKAGSLPQYKEGTKRKGKGKEKAVGPIVGEMGEILREEDEDEGRSRGKKEKEKERRKKDETVRVRVPLKYLSQKLTMVPSDVKTSVEEAPSSTISAIEGKSTPIVETVAEEPVKAVVEEDTSSVTRESAGAPAATMTEVVTSEEVKSADPVPESNVENVPAPTIEVAPIVEKPSISISDPEAAPMPMKVVAKEEPVLNEPDVVNVNEESSPQIALEDGKFLSLMRWKTTDIMDTPAVKTSQEEFVVEDTIPSESKPVPPVVESTSGRTLKSVNVPSIEEHAPVVEESAAAVVENASVIGLEKIDAPAVDEAVSKQPVPVAEGVTESVVLVEDTALEEPEAEPVKTEPSSTASDNLAAGNIDTAGPENAEEITPVTEESPATRSENATEPTEQTSAPPQEAVVTPGAEEHDVSVVEPEHKLEIHVPVESVSSTDAAQEETSVNAPAVEVSTSTTVESPVHETSDLTKETPTDVEELIPSAATEPEPEVKTLEAEALPAIANHTIEDTTHIIEESALSVPVELTPVAVNQPAEIIDAVESKEETLVHREEIAPVIKEPALSTAKPETGVLATEVDSSLPITDEHTAESVKLLEDTPVPATEDLEAIVEECIPSVKAPEPAEAETGPVDIGHLAKESTDITNAESPAPIPIEKEAAPIVEQPQAEASLAPMEVEPMLTKNTTEGTPAPVFETPFIKEPASANDAEMEPKSEAHHPPASAASEEPVEGTIVVDSTEVPVPTEVAPIVEGPAPSATAETESIPVTRHELDQEDTLTSQPADQTSMPKEPIVDDVKEPLAVDSTTSATESWAQTEAPAHTVTESTPTVEEKAPIVDSKEIIPAPIVEAAPEHVVPKEAPVLSQVDAPATTEEAIQNPVVIKSDTSVPTAEETTSVIEERTSVDRDSVNEPPTIAVEPIAASDPMPTTKDVPAPLADVGALAAESEPVVETPESVTVKPVLAVTGESDKEIVPVAEHAPNTEVSDEVVPIAKNDTVPSEATIVEEKPAKVEVTPVAQGELIFSEVITIGS
ncbi:hypothetical protein C0993_001705 [Termitomyces sp. T159_Od127]|nr:hypothetical protein C0993_001705 [Termitomyces sp. T159_Od127]